MVEHYFHEIPKVIYLATENVWYITAPQTTKRNQTDVSWKFEWPMQICCGRENKDAEKVEQCYCV